MSSRPALLRPQKKAADAHLDAKPAPDPGRGLDDDSGPSSVPYRPDSGGKFNITDLGPEAACGVFYERSLDGKEAVIRLGRPQPRSVRAFGRGAPPKLLIPAEVMPYNEHDAQAFAGQRLDIWIPYPSGKAGKASKYYRWWSVLNGGPPSRRDRMSLRIFEGALVRVRLKTSTTDYRGRLKPEAMWETVIEDIVALEVPGKHSTQ